MMLDEDKAESKLKHLHFEVLTLGRLYYQNTITVTIKGREMELVKILTIFTSIDVSNNNFEGPIPEEIGRFKLLYVLNLSHNGLTGPIPSSIGNLQQLESLDLSVNHLSEEIPKQLARLNFLSVLNLSYNNLVGRIPLGTQLQSFLPTSYLGNVGLCGAPLMNRCTNSSKLRPSSQEINWFFIAMSIGFGVVVAPLTLSMKLNKWYDDRIKRILNRRR